MINSVCSDVFESRQKSFVGLKRKRWSLDRSRFSDVSRFKSKWQTSNSQYLLPKLRNAFSEADRLYDSWQLRDWDGIVKIHCSPHGWVWLSPTVWSSSRWTAPREGTRVRGGGSGGTGAVSRRIRPQVRAVAVKSAVYWRWSLWERRLPCGEDRRHQAG